MEHVWVRRSILRRSVVLCLALSPALAFATQSPPGCSSNDLNASISFPMGSSQVVCGTTVPFTVTVNNGLTLPLTACDIEALPVTFTCPGPTGMPNGPSTVLATSDDFPNPSETIYPPVNCVIGDVTGGGCSCGPSPAHVAQVRAGPGLLHDNPDFDDLADITKTVSVQCITTTTTSTSTTTSTTIPSLPHFQCYETKRRQFAGIPVTLEDEFGSVSTTAMRPERLCAPADKNGEDPTAPSNPAHLVGYTIKHRITPILGQQITNQFGTVVLDIRRAERLLVPSAKAIGTVPPPPLPPGVLDHFQCYKVGHTPGTPRFQRHTVTSTDQFGSRTITLGQPNRLCAPVNKNGEDPTAPSHPDHLLCYQIRRSAFKGTPVSVTNQFGSQLLEPIQRVEFCVPSRLETGNTTTTTTVSTTTTTIQGSPSPAFLAPTAG